MYVRAASNNYKRWTAKSKFNVGDTVSPISRKFLTIIINKECAWSSSIIIATYTAIFFGASWLTSGFLRSTYPLEFFLKDVILHSLEFVTCTRGQVEERTRVQAAPRDSALCVWAHFLSFLHHGAKQCPSCRAWHFHANTHTRSPLALGGCCRRDYKSTTLEKSTRLGFTD